MSKEHSYVWYGGYYAILFTFTDTVFFHQILFTKNQWKGTANGITVFG